MPNLIYYTYFSIFNLVPNTGQDSVNNPEGRIN